MHMYLQAAEEAIATPNRNGVDEKYSEVTLQPHRQQTQSQPTTFWTLREKEMSSSVPVLADNRNYKQMCRSRKFK